MSAVCVNTSSSIILVHTIQNRGLLSDLCGMCTSIYEIGTDSNSLKLVKEKPERLPYCHRAVCLISLNRKTRWWGGNLGRVLEVSSFCEKKITFGLFYIQVRQK